MYVKFILDQGDTEWWQFTGGPTKNPQIFRVSVYTVDSV